VTLNPKVLSVLTLVSTAAAAIAVSGLPFMAGAFPGGMFETAAIGPLPLWAACTGLSVLLVVVFVGHLLEMTRGKRR
jgi:hypothetical protein